MVRQVYTLSPAKVQCLPPMTRQRKTAWNEHRNHRKKESDSIKNRHFTFLILPAIVARPQRATTFLTYSLFPLTFQSPKDGEARVKYCSQKGFLKNEKLSRRSQYRLNRLFTEIRSGGRPIFRIFHEISGNQSCVGICAGEDPYHTRTAADLRFSRSSTLVEEIFLASNCGKA